MTLSVETAWQTTTGRPDVAIAVLDSGIEWNDLEAMRDLRAKTRLGRGELDPPLRDRAAATEPGVDCSSYADGWDASGNGVFNVLDYACDSRASTPLRRWATGRSMAAARCSTRRTC